MVANRSQADDASHSYRQQYSAMQMAVTIDAPSWCSQIQPYLSMTARRLHHNVSRLFCPLTNIPLSLKRDLTLSILKYYLILSEINFNF